MTYQECINKITEDKREVEAIRMRNRSKTLFNKTFDRVFDQRMEMWDRVRPEFLFESECKIFAIEAAQGEVHRFLNEYITLDEKAEIAWKNYLTKTKAEKYKEKKVKN